MLYQLVSEMVKYTYLNDTEESPSRRKKTTYSLVEHSLVSMPPYKFFHGSTIWICKMIYIQLICTCEKNMYCASIVNYIQWL